MSAVTGMRKARGFVGVQMTAKADPLEHDLYISDAP